MTGRDMTDEQVRAVLERINAIYAEVWKQVNARLVKPGPDPLDVFLCKTLRRLAECWQALGEIAETPHAENCKTESMIKPSVDDCDCHVSIARNAVKRGK